MNNITKKDYYDTSKIASPNGGGVKSRADLNQERLNEQISTVERDHTFTYLPFITQMIDDPKLHEVTNRIKDVVAELHMKTPRVQNAIYDIHNGKSNSGIPVDFEERDNTFIKTLEFLESLRKSLHGNRAVMTTAKANYVVANILNRINQSGESGYTTLKNQGYINEQEEAILNEAMNAPIAFNHAPVIIAGLIDVLEASLRVIATKYNQALGGSRIVEHVPELAENIIDIINNAPDKATAEVRVINEFINSNLLPDNYDISKNARAGRQQELHQIASLFGGPVDNNGFDTPMPNVNAWQSQPPKINPLDNNGVFGGTSMIFDPNKGVSTMIHDEVSYNATMRNRAINGVGQPPKPQPYMQPQPMQPNPQPIVPNTAIVGRHRNDLNINNNTPNRVPIPTSKSNNNYTPPSVGTAISSGPFSPLTMPNGPIDYNNPRNIDTDDIDMCANFYDAIKKDKMLGSTVTYTADQFPFEPSHNEYCVKTGKKLVINHTRDFGSNGLIRWTIPNIITTAHNPNENRMRTDANGKVRIEDFDFNYKPILVSDFVIPLTDGREMVYAEGIGWHAMDPANSLKNQMPKTPYYKNHIRNDNERFVMPPRNDGKKAILKPLDRTNDIAIPTNQNAYGYNPQNNIVNNNLNPYGYQNTGYSTASTLSGSNISQTPGEIITPDGRRYRKYDEDILFSYDEKIFVNEYGQKYDTKEVMDYLQNKSNNANNHTYQYQNDNNNQYVNNNYSYNNNTQGNIIGSFGNYYTSADLNNRQWIVQDIQQDNGGVYKLMRNVDTGETVKEYDRTSINPNQYLI